MRNKVSLPENWSYTLLGAITRIVYGKGLPTKQLKPSGYPVFGANGVIGFNDSYLYEHPQVLISCRGAYSGKINFSPPTSFVTNNSLVLEITDEEKISKRYLYYVLQSVDKSKLVTGSAQPQVTINNAALLNLPVPPQEEQKRIVAKIEELFSELDAGVECLKKAQAQLKTYRRSVLKCAFEGHLTKDYIGEGGKSEGWSTLPLGNLVEEPRYGTSRKCVYAFEGTGVLRIPNIADGVIDSGDLKGASFAAGELETYGLNEGDVLTIRSNGSLELVGKSALISKKDERFLFAGYLIRLRPIANKVVPKFLLYAMSSPKLREQIEGKAKSTSGVNNINSKELKGLSVPWCPINLQHQVVAEIERRLSVCDKMNEAIYTVLRQSDQLRQSILRKAFSGNLVEQDDSDEPASVLLQRIWVERENLSERNAKSSKKGSQQRSIKQMAETVKTILEVLEEHEGRPMASRSVWQASNHKDDIDSFYTEIKELIDKKKIKELERDGRESFLTLAKSK